MSLFRAMVWIPVLLAAAGLEETSSPGVSPRTPPADPYPDHSHLLLYREEAGDLQPVRTAKDWSLRRKHILEGMQAVMGPLPDRSQLPPLDMQVVGREVRNGYSLLTIQFVPEAGDRLSALLYLPTAANARNPRPAMLALHPTHSIGKGVVDGRAERAGRAYGKELAERGYIVLAPDYPSFGDAAQYEFNTDRYESGTMKGIFNHMRCVDLLQSLPEVDPQRIGAIGHSLGGHNAMFVGVFDERIKVVVSSCGWTPFHDYYGGKLAGWSSDRYMPKIRDVYGLDPDRMPFDFYEVVAALAPRAFFSCSPLHDENFDVAGVKKAVPAAALVYRLLNCEQRLQVRYPNAAHDFPNATREEAYRFIAEMLQ